MSEHEELKNISNPQNTTDIEAGASEWTPMHKRRSVRAATAMLLGVGLAASALLPKGESDAQTPVEQTTVVDENETPVVSTPEDSHVTFEDYKEQLRNSTFKLARRDKGSSDMPQLICDVNALRVEGSDGEPMIVLGTATHCVDTADDPSNVIYPIQDSMRGMGEDVAAIDIMQMPDYKYEYLVYNLGDMPDTAEPIAEIAAIAESVGVAHDETVLMLPIAITPELAEGAMDYESKDIKPGEKIFYIGQSYAASEGVEVVLQYEGKTMQYDRNMVLHNASIPTGSAESTAYQSGASGGFGVSESGVLTGPQFTVLTPNMSEQMDGWIDEVGAQNGVDVSGKDIIQFSVKDEAVIAAQIEVLESVEAR